MRFRPLLAAFCLLLTMVGAVATPAVAQDEPGAGLSDLEKALGESLAPGGPTTTTPDPGGDEQSIPELVDPSTPVAPPAGTTPAPAVGTVTPTPPGYLVPGQSAAVQPVAAVESLREPDLPLEPVRLAALAAVIIAALLVAIAALLRGLGLRTAVRQPVVVAPVGRGGRIRERTGLLADDIRDFLRHHR